MLFLSLRHPLANLKVVFLSKVIMRKSNFVKELQQQDFT